jgi:hypothetical protein
MKRRLRKKKHLAEFKEFGFEVGGSFSVVLTDNEKEAFLDDFIEFLEDRNLCTGGGISSAGFDFYITGGDNTYPVTEETRSIVRTRLESDARLKDVRVSALTDAWYGATP